MFIVIMRHGVGAAGERHAPLDVEALKLHVDVAVTVILYCRVGDGFASEAGMMLQFKRVSEKEKSCLPVKKS